MEIERFALGLSFLGPAGTNMRALKILASLGFLAAALVAQCPTLWQSGAPAPGPRYGGVSATAWWDPDGAGPRGTVLVIGGTFALPSVGASNLATYDPATGRWGAFPVQPNGHVQSVATLANGDLAIGGQFTAIGAQPLGHLAIWDGAGWSAPGGGIPGGSVLAIQALANGDLVAGGSFATAGGIASPGLARWDGSRWHPLGAFSGHVLSMAQRPNGNLVVGGTFAQPGPPFTRNIAEWTGTAWLPFGSGIGGTYDRVEALAVLANGDVVASGFFNLAGGVPVNRIARWDGSAWSAMGAGIDTAPHALLPLANGDLLAASVTSVNQVFVDGVARWDGSQWQLHAPNIGAVASMTTMPNGDLLVAGSPANPAIPAIRGLARWDGAAWHALASGFDDTVRGLVALPNGELVAYGSFALAAGAPVGPIARWNGQAWWAMAGAATPVPWAWGSATCAALDASGNLWMSGSINGTPAPGNVVRWTGNGWQPVGTGIANVVALAVDGTQPIVGCAVYPGYGPAILRWNGIQWLGYGLGLDGPVRALLVRRSGELVAGGEFLNSGTTPVSRIARWDGSAWQPFGPGVDGPVRALAELNNGELVAGGDFITDGTGLRPLNLVARWDGSGWQSFGAGLGGDPGTSVRALLVLPDGDLLAGGDFRQAGGLPARGIARWNRASWQAVDGGVDGMVLSLAQLPDGEVAAGGDFSIAGAQDAAHLARLRTGCPAAAAGYGAGCAGSAGTLALSTARLPWVGGVFRATCYGVSATGIGVDVLGLQASQLPLSTLHPAGGVGCVLLASPEIATLRLPANGAIESAFLLPDDPALVGVRLYQQIVVGELNAALALVNLASSNGLALTVGAF